MPVKKTKTVPEKKSEEPKKTDDTPELTCIVCGGDKFAAEDGRVVYCGRCGSNADWAYTEKYAASAMKYVREKTKSRSASPDKRLPTCDAKRTSHGEVITCGSRDWVATEKNDGFAYCGECGANWVGDQPDDIEELVKMLKARVPGPELTNLKIPDEEGVKRAREARRGKPVVIEDYTVRE